MENERMEQLEIGEEQMPPNDDRRTCDGYCWPKGELEFCKTSLMIMGIMTDLYWMLGRNILCFKPPKFVENIIKIDCTDETVSSYYSAVCIFSITAHGYATVLMWTNKKEYTQVPNEWIYLGIALGSKVVWFIFSMTLAIELLFVDEKWDDYIYLKMSACIILILFHIHGFIVFFSLFLMAMNIIPTPRNNV